MRFPMHDADKDRIDEPAGLDAPADEWHTVPSALGTIAR